MRGKKAGGGRATVYVSEGCHYCKKVKENLDVLTSAGVSVKFVDVEKNNIGVERVSSLPTIDICKKDRCVRVEGLVSKSEIKRVLSSMVELDRNI